MTTGRLVRVVSSPGQAGSARIEAGSGDDRLDRHPGRREPPRQVRGDGLLGARDARDPDDRGELRSERRRVDRVGRATAARAARDGVSVLVTPRGGAAGSGR